MHRALLAKASRHRGLVFLATAVLALLVIAPAAYAAYYQDSGVVACRNEGVAVQVKAKGNPVYIRGRNSTGKMVIYDDFRTYSGTTTRVYRAAGAKRVEWIVFVDSGESGAYVSDRGTFGYCY